MKVYKVTFLSPSSPPHREEEELKLETRNWSQKTRALVVVSQYGCGNNGKVFDNFEPHCLFCEIAIMINSGPAVPLTMLRGLNEREIPHLSGSALQM